MIRRLLITALIALVAAGGALAVFGLPLADIRPEGVSLADDPVAEAEGRRLLARMLQSHGGADALHRHHTLDLDLRDTWVGLGTLFNPWPADDQRVHLTLRVHTFDSEVRFVDGPREGQVWGIRDFATYRREGDRQDPIADADLRFMLPTTHYFVEMPQRLTEAEIVRSVGRERVGDREYDLVYATWGTVDANRAYDQYRIYLDPETGRLAKVWYTVREIGSFVEGVGHFDDLREVDGFLVAHRVAVTPGIGDDPATDALHTMVFDGFTFDR
ncbi:MAG: hypothetical protein ABMA64_12380 [Myxococcota bacterium]